MGQGVRMSVQIHIPYTKEVNDQASFALNFDNALENVWCDALIDWFERNGDARTVEANRETRKDVQKWLPQESDLWVHLQNAKRDMLTNYLYRYPSVYRGKKKLRMPENKIQRTDPFGGGFHNFHSEVSHWENCARALVWTIYLNDMPSNEGETEFLFDKIRIQPKKGMGVVWPAAWMFQHRGNPVHTHSKYIATGWYWYPEETGYYGNTKSS